MSSLSTRYINSARRSPHLKWLSWALLVDWLVVIILNRISVYIESTYPYKRDVRHQLGDINISWPMAVHERVPSYPLLDQLSFWLPFGILAAVGASRLSLHEVHHSILALWSSRAVMRITVEWIKNRVGRLRPDFLDRCKFDILKQDCTGLPDVIKDGRRSFPSGHSSTAFQGLFILTLFIAGKNGAFAYSAPFPRSSFHQSKLLRFSIAVAPLFLAVWIAITRLEDHRHHVEDVIAGSTIGILSALAGYLIYFPNPFDSNEIAVMDKPRTVYGALEDEGGIHLSSGGPLLPEHGGEEA
ncbi:acid phosphatase/Vanadium-dependent haloperoxidase [Meredithblackwellia eburnea MCA 4105]